MPRRTGSRLGIEDLKHLKAEPPVADARSGTNLVDDLLVSQPPQKISGSGLADSKLLLHVTNRENGVRE
jgi:hypothetical protein